MRSMSDREIYDEATRALAEGRMAVLRKEWDSAPTLQSCTGNIDLWGMKAPIGGCGCIPRPRGRVVFCGVKKYGWEWQDGRFMVYAEYDPKELIHLLTDPCKHRKVLIDAEYR